ncbi:DUF3419 family protein [Fodinibius sediminis]|nr:BtaA family protein [Fodinibius sediminis]
MEKFTNIVKNLQDRLFNSVTSNKLVYNTCWEDPRLDREMLQINEQSNLVMLTSAGCNAFDYLLDAPREIHCVDENQAQNALFELKRALFQNGDFSLLWDFFGEGIKEEAARTYHHHLRPRLGAPTRRYWDRNINFFSPSPAVPSFYYHGTSGKVAFMIRKKIQRKGLHVKINKLLDAQSIKEQTYYFYKVEDSLWSGFFKWLADQQITMNMLGVPACQRELINEKEDGGISGYIHRVLRHIFTRRPIQDNYFWRVYLTGSYTPDCCPNYLLRKHYERIKQQEHIIRTYTSSLLQFLLKNPGRYTHFVLLDHLDWMIKDPDQLAEVWHHILNNSVRGTRILFRSAGTSTDFLPPFVHRRLEFQPALTKRLHTKDRVGTYGSTHLGIVQ